ncbi:PhzF family phenazine biosynthesis protein [Novosphingobium sp.]|uniref:PhzF family phenazine biosynthesis protein n=1 Tax=Novosphingobium sp. TaxID=1874826 RepID=UPI003BAA6F8A
MPSLDYAHVDVFADAPLRGNSLPVFHDAPDLDDATLLAITQELRHFEAIFLQPTGEANLVRARIFDLIEELPFAGHPLIGAAAVLQHRAAPAASGEWTFALADRWVKVRVTYGDAGYFGLLDQGAPRFLGTVADRAEIAEAFGLAADDLDHSLPLEIASTGLDYMVIPLRPDRIGTARIGSDITVLMQRHGAQFAVLLDPATREMRHWNNDGIVEDVATGSAAGVVGAYCRKHGITRPGESLVLAQGRFAGRPSQLEVTAESEGETITRILVGGRVAFVGHGTLDLLA